MEMYVYVQMRLECEHWLIFWFHILENKSLAISVPHYAAKTLLRKWYVQSVQVSKEHKLCLHIFMDVDEAKKTENYNLA